MKMDSKRWVSILIINVTSIFSKNMATKIDINLDVLYLDMYDYGNEAPDNQEGDGVNALNLQWVLGFNKELD